MKRKVISTLDQDRTIKLIESLGGTCKLARYFDRTPTAVTHWKQEGMPANCVRILQAELPDNPAVKETLDFHPWRKDE